MTERLAAYVVQEFLAVYENDEMVSPGTHRRVLEDTEFKEGTRQRIQADFLRDNCVFTYNRAGTIVRAVTKRGNGLLFSVE